MANVNAAKIEEVLSSGIDADKLKDIEDALKDLDTRVKALEQA